METRLGRGGTRRYLTTDDPAWFAGRAAALLGRPIAAEAVHLPAVE
jgi:glutamate racemase